MLSRLVKDSGVYAVGVVVGRAVSLVMIPIYTRVLTPSDYGIVEAITRLVDTLGLVVAAGLAEALLRYFHEADGIEDRRRLVSTALLMMVALSGGAVLAFVPLSPFATTLLFGARDQTPLVLLAGITVLLDNLVGLPMTLLRAEGRPWRFTVYSTLQLATALALNLVFVVHMRLGIQGVIISSFIKSAAWGFFLTAGVLVKVGFRFDRRLARRLWSYGLPLVPAGFAIFVMHFSDRLFLVRVASAEELGLYSLGYRFAFLLALFLRVLVHAWWPWAFRVAAQPGAASMLANGGAFIVTGLTTFGIGIMLLSQPTLHFLAGEQFWAAGQYIPLLTGAYWLFAIGAPLSIGVRIAERTGRFASANGLAAATCILLSVWLIPRYGAWGAVWVTGVAFAVRVVAIGYVSQSAYFIPHRWGVFAVGGSAMLVAMLVAAGLGNWDRWPLPLDIAARALLWFVLSLGLWLYFGWRTDTLRGGLLALRTILNRIRSSVSARGAQSARGRE